MIKYPIVLVSAVFIAVGNQFAAGQGGAKVETKPGANPALDAVSNPNRPGGAGGPNAVGIAGKSVASSYIESVERSVKLTPGQKETITKILETRDKALESYRTKNAEKLKAAMQAMTDAYKGKDAGAIAKAQKQYQEANAGTIGIYKQAQADLDNVLTVEQKAKRQEDFVARTLKWMTEPAVLTGEQSAQIKAIIAARNTAGATGGGGRDWHQSIQDLLTPQQKVVIVKHRSLEYAKRVHARANLTAGQLQQIGAFLEELAATPDTKSDTIVKKLSEAINALLTEEQKEAMKVGPAGKSAPGSVPAQPAVRPAGPPK